MFISLYLPPVGVQDLIETVREHILLSDARMEKLHDRLLSSTVPGARYLHCEENGTRYPQQILRQPVRVTVIQVSPVWYQYYR